MDQVFYHKFTTISLNPLLFLSSEEKIKVPGITRIIVQELAGFKKELEKEIVEVETERVQRREMGIGGNPASDLKNKNKTSSQNETERHLRATFERK